MPVRSIDACDLALAQFPLSSLARLCRQLLGAGVLLAAAGGAAAQAIEPSAALPKITVKGKAETTVTPAYAGGQLARGGSLGLLGTQDVMDVPFSTTNYTSELLDNLQARTIADALVNDASVRMTTGGNGFDDTFQIRGYAVSATDVGFNGLYGLISQNRVPAQLVERVELLKGPGAIVNGISPSGSVGGAINVVAKRAGDTPLTRATTTYTGTANFTQAIDVGRRFGPDNAWGVRFNGLVRDGEASIDDGNVRSGLGAVAVDYNGGPLRWSLDAIWQRDDTDNFRPQISLDAVGTIAAPPDARTNWYPGTTLVQQDSTIATRLEYDISDKMTAYAGIGYRDGTNDQVFPRSIGAVTQSGDFRVQNTWYDSYTKTTSANAGLSWRFDTAGVGHTVVFGITGMQQEAGNVYIPGAGTVPSNIYNPVPLPVNTATRTEPVKASDTMLSSFALADTLSIDNGRWLVTLGARHQTVRSHSYNTTTGAEASSYDASTVTPLGGVVFKPVDNVSVYANYTAGLTRGQTVSQTASPEYSNGGAVLDPYKSEQIEAGVKVDWGTITTTAAVYQLTRPSAIRNSANNLAYDGEQRNRGVELSAYGELQRGLRGTASMAFIDPHIAKTETGANEGNDAAGVPDFTASVGADWDTPWVPGLALNGRVLYTSGAYLNNTNTQKFDAWTRVDIGARYIAKVADTPVTFRANVENLFDKNYWLTTGTYVAVGSGRTLVMSAAIDF